MNGSTAACNGTGPLDICEVTTNWNPDDTIACNLDRNGDGTAASAYGVWVPADNEWHFFGTDATGAQFCCEVAGSGGYDHFIAMNGQDTNASDTIDLQWSSGSGAYRMSDDGLGFATQCNVFGSGGNDTLDGSDSTSSVYEENLAGGDGDDTIYGHAGDEIIDGNDGDDKLYGGGGNDVIRGGAGDDDLFGDDGNDALYGDLDTGAGAHGIDDLDGGAGDDLLCSGGRDTFLVGEESLSGGDGADVLWANHHHWATGVVGDASTVDGGLAFDYCDSQTYVTTVSTCEIALTGGLFPSPTPPVTCW